MKGRILHSNASHLASAVFLAAALQLIAPGSSLSQCTPPVHRVWVRATDLGAGNDTVWFGWEYGATPGLDPWLCEIDSPPAPPAGVFDLRFVSPPGRFPPGGWGQGRYVDYRPYHPGAIDTFRVKFQPGEGGFPFSFSWDTALVAFAYDSCVIQDEFGGFLVRARMREVSTVQVTNPAFTSLLILAWQRLPEGTPPSTRVRLQVSDSGTGIDNLWIGYDPTARPGIDLHLGEFEVPMMPPSGVFFTLLKNPPGHEGADTASGLGMGSFSDYRTHRSEAAIDTHRVGFQPGGDGFPMYIRWSMDSLRALCDSAIIVDEFGGVFYRKRMDLDSVLSVTHEAFTRLLVIRYGQNPFVDVGEREKRPASDFVLEQNYPNPFNPSTVIQFTVPVGTYGRTSLRVYDLVGREVRTLVDGPEEQGSHVITFEAGGLPSGIYYCRLRTGVNVRTRAMLLLR